MQPGGCRRGASGENDLQFARCQSDSERSPLRRGLSPRQKVANLAIGMAVDDWCESCALK
jgi:hypothetical protein